MPSPTVAIRLNRFSAAVAIILVAACAEDSTAPQRSATRPSSIIVPGTPDTALQAIITVSRDSIRPQLARFFDADSQTWSDPRVTSYNTRTDTLLISVSGILYPSLNPLGLGDTVFLSVTPQEGSGFHPVGQGLAPHTNRPQGSFFLPGQSLQQQGRINATLAIPITDSTNSTIQAIYRTSGVSGLELLRAHVSHHGALGEYLVDDSTHKVKIRWDSTMVAMPRTDPVLYYYSSQSTTRHGDINNWIIPTVRDSLLRVFQMYFDTVASPRFINGETKFVITDVSLQWGGLLDVADGAQGSWHEPHQRHRVGADTDLRSSSLNSSQQTILRRLFPHAHMSIVTESNHFHVSPDPPPVP